MIQPARVWHGIAAIALAVMGGMPPVQASVISGSISDWPDTGPVLSIGDGTHHVSLWWSINTFDKGWFYGSAFTGDSNVAFAAGVSDITQIADAGALAFADGAIGPLCDATCDGVGDFVVWKNIVTGHYGALRIDDIVWNGGNPRDARLNGTWWFQTDGSGDFTGAIPLPATLALLALSLSMMALRRRPR